MQVNRIDETTSRKFSLLAFVCALMVVFIHIPVTGHESGSCWWFIRIFSCGICKVAVPFFFFAAGYFVAGHMDEKGYWLREVRKRVTSLIVPLLIWSCLFFVAKAVLDCLVNYGAGRPLLSDFRFSFETLLCILGLDPFCHPYLGVMWFVRALFCCFLFLPLIGRLANWLSIILLWLIYGSAYSFPEAYPPPLKYLICEGPLSVMALACIMAGVYWRRRGLRLSASTGIRMFALLTSVGLVLLSALGWHLAWWHPAIYTWLSIPFLLLALVAWCPAMSLPGFLQGLSFLIYVLHKFVFLPLGICRMHFFKDLNVVSYVVYGLIVCIGSVLCARGLRFFPSVCRIVTGAR